MIKWLKYVLLVLLFSQTYVAYAYNYDGAVPSKDCEGKFNALGKGKYTQSSEKISKGRTTIMNKLAFLLGSWFFGLLAACSHSLNYQKLSEIDKKTYHSAICKANNYLEENGYFQKKLIGEKDSITLEMWDKINYEKGGIFDWEKLFADRAGLYENTLFGIRQDQEEFLIFYNLDETYKCLSINKADDAPTLHEANCLRGSDVILVLESEVDCVELDEP